MVQFDTWSSSISIDDLLDVTEMAVEEMALIVHGSDPPVAWVAPHLRRGAPRHCALAGARTSAIWSALIDLREWHAQLDEIHDLPPPLHVRSLRQAEVPGPDHEH